MSGFNFLRLEEHLIALLGEFELINGDWTDNKNENQFQGL